MASSTSTRLLPIRCFSQAQMNQQLQQQLQQQEAHLKRKTQATKTLCMQIQLLPPPQQCQQQEVHLEVHQEHTTAQQFGVPLCCSFSGVRQRRLVLLQLTLRFWHIQLLFT